MLKQTKMAVPIQAKKQYWRYIPLVGIPCFVWLYIIATLYYPGGSQTDPNAIGFSWLHNYWCNLLNNEAISGQVNKAQPIAIAAMVVLCISLTVFWYCFPLFYNRKKWIQASGALQRHIGHGGGFLAGRIGA